MECLMRISQWGDSLAIRLPKKLIADLGVREGDDVDIRSDGDGRIAIVTRDGRTALLKLRRPGAKPSGIRQRP